MLLLALNMGKHDSNKATHSKADHKGPAVQGANTALLTQIKHTLDGSHTSLIDRFVNIVSNLFERAVTTLDAKIESFGIAIPDLEEATNHQEGMLTSLTVSEV